MQMKNKFGTGWIIVTVALVLAMFLLVIPALSGIWSIADMPLRVCVALLGVGVTTLVTKVLLSSQSEGELKQAKSRKVFEEKLGIYKDFIDFLYEVVKGGQMTREQKLHLQFKTSLVIMHCLPESIGDISTAISNILRTTCSEDAKESTNPTKNIMVSLVDIVKVLRKDLYNTEEAIDVDGKAIDGFCKAFDNAKETDTPIQTVVPTIPVSTTPPAPKKEDVPSDALTSTPSAVSLWKEAVKKWQEQGWQIIDGNPDTYDGLTIYSENLFGQAKEDVYIKFGLLEGEYHYVEAKYKEYREFSQSLKWEFGGRRTYGTWYTPLDSPYCNPDGKLADCLASDAKLQKHLIDWVEKLQPILCGYHRIVEWRDAVKIKQRDGWNIIPFNWYILGCEWDNQEEGTPYFDVNILKNKDGETIELQLANRQGSREKLADTLKRIGLNNTQIEEDNWASIEKLPLDSDSAEVVERIHHWMQKIDNKA